MARACVVFGRKIVVDGQGFAPETPVHLFLSNGRYTLPGAEPSGTFRSDAGGEVHGFLVAPEGGTGGRWAWIREAVFATGLNRGGEHEGRSFDLVVLGTGSVCRILGRQAE